MVTKLGSTIVRGLRQVMSFGRRTRAATGQRLAIPADEINDHIVALMSTGQIDRAVGLIEQKLPKCELIPFYKQTITLEIPKGESRMLILGQEFHYDHLLLRSSNGRFYLFLRTTERPDLLEIKPGQVFRLGRNDQHGLPGSISGTHLTINIVDGKLSIEDRSRFGTIISSKVAVRIVEQNVELKARLFRVGKNYDAHSTEFMFNLLAIALSGDIFYGNNEVIPRGKLTSGGPFYVVLRKDHESCKRRIKSPMHLKYFVPGKRELTDFLALLAEAKDLGVIGQEQFNLIAKKVCTYEEFINSPPKV